jgi:hypothetical protein
LVASERTCDSGSAAMMSGRLSAAAADVTSWSNWSSATATISTWMPV